MEIRQRNKLDEITVFLNMRLAQSRVTWLIEHSTSHQLLWCIDSFVFRNRQLRQHAKRYMQAYPDTFCFGLTPAQ